MTTDAYDAVCGWENDAPLTFPSGQAELTGWPLEVRLPKDLASFMGSVVPVYGWSKRNARWAYGAKTLAAQIVRSLRAMRDAWGYAPKHLVLNLRKTGKPGIKGLAYPQHQTKHGPVRLITVNPTLIEEYTPESFFRVMLHELSHHKRFDEGHRASGAKKSHDGRFCAILARVDAIVARNPAECRTSHDDVDPHAVKQKFGASAAELKVRVRSKTMDGKKRSFLEVLDPHGTVVKQELLTSRSLRVVGEMMSGAWDRVKVIGAGASQKTFSSFFEERMKRFSPKASARLERLWKQESKRWKARR